MLGPTLKLVKAVSFLLMRKYTASKLKKEPQQQGVFEAAVVRQESSPGLPHELVRILGPHPSDPGSSPGGGMTIFLSQKQFSQRRQHL